LETAKRIYEKVKEGVPDFEASSAQKKSLVSYYYFVM